MSQIQRAQVGGDQPTPSVFVPHTVPPVAAVEIARRAEHAGFDAVLLADSLLRDATVALGAIAARTERIPSARPSRRSGPATRPRSPCAATLDALAPGRVLLGLGAWWEPIASSRIVAAADVDPESVSHVAARLARPCSDQDVLDVAPSVPDAVVTRLTVAGTRDDCLQRLEDYRRAGCDRPILAPVGDDRLPRLLATFGG